jgi:uncharacterized surface protein with fasciclin (FAS1) repeats
LYKQKKITMKKLISLFTILSVSLFIASCSNDDDGGTPTPDGVTIVDFVANNTEYSSLGAALDAAGLTATLSGTTNFTVFAPNNAAFSTFLSANGFASLDDVPVDALREILLNHVLEGVNNSGDLATGYTTSLATGASSSQNLSMFINTASGVRINGVSQVTQADITVDNGVIHAVDAVINLPSVVTFALADPTFSNLVAALTRPDQPDFVSVLTTSNGTSPAPFTVFAPTDAAFADLLVELGAGGLEDIDGSTLTAVLNMHVIAEANVRAEDLVSGTVTTLGGNITIDANNATITDSNGRVSNIIVVNVQAANGVVHAINKVILP